MTTRTVRSGVAPLRSAPFETFAGVCVILSGVIGFLYAVAFVVLQHILLSGLFLMLGGLLSTAVLAAVYDRLRETEASFALWALLLGIAALWARQSTAATISLTLSIHRPPSPTFRTRLTRVVCSLSASQAQRYSSSGG
jgi:drug/metabolite transporter (DMT)-like permease